MACYFGIHTVHKCLIFVLFSHLLLASPNDIRENTSQGLQQTVSRDLGLRTRFIRLQWTMHQIVMQLQNTWKTLLRAFVVRLHVHDVCRTP